MVSACMPELNPKIPEAGNITNPPDQTPDRVPYIAVNNDGRILEKPTTVVRTAPAPQRRTWAGYLDSSFFQFNPQQPIWYFSDDFLYNTLDRVLGFDFLNKVWKPLSVDPNGQLNVSSSFTLSVPPIFQDDFSGVALDNQKWLGDGGFSVGGGFLNLGGDGTQIGSARTINFFTRTASTPLVMTMQAGIDSDFTFGFIEKSETLALDPLVTPPQPDGVYAHYNHGTEELTLFIVSNNAEYDTTVDVSALTSTQTVFQLIFEGENAFVFVNGTKIVEYPVALSDPIANFPPAQLYNAFVVGGGDADGGDGIVEVARVWVSTQDEGLPISGYDDNGTRRVARFTEDGLLMVDTEMTVPATITIADVNFTTTQTDPLTVNGTVTVTPSGTQNVNLSQVNAQTVNVGNGTAGTGTQRVAIASDNTAFSVNAAVTNFPTLTYYQQNTGITANATAGTTIDMSASPVGNFTLAVIRTAGATDVVSVTMQGSNDNTNFFATGTAIATVVGGSASTSLANTPWRYIRAFVTTVGAGNTLTTQLVAAR
jgi:hypothetical protein